jgi:hypothetical protein
MNRACPTTGSDRGSLRDHDLTLIVVHRYDGLLAIQVNLEVRAFHRAEGCTLLRQPPFEFFAVHGLKYKQCCLYCQGYSQTILFIFSGVIPSPQRKAEPAPLLGVSGA